VQALLFSIGAIALLGFGLSMADVKTDYNHSADFAAYKIFSWVKIDAGNSL